MTWVWAVIIGVVLIGGGLYIVSQDSTQQSDTENLSTEQLESQTLGAETSTTPNTAPENPGTTDSGTSGGITMAVVATHNTASSCWTVIGGNVYDLTSWISQHPGGARAITQLCGTDGTALFEGQHAGGQRQADMLATMKIGVLAR